MEVQNLDFYKVTLTDKLTRAVLDLKAVREYQFSGLAGLITDRFFLTVSSLSTGIEISEKTENQFNIYHGFNLINVQPLADEWNGKTGSIKIIDVSGNILRNLTNAEFRTNDFIRLPSPKTNGLYIIEIRSGVMKYVGKVVVR